MMLNWDLWVLIGFAAQVLFSMRFVVQWIASERKRQSVIPVSFWYFSIAGSLVLLLYAIHRNDPVFTLGQAFGTFVYVRNLMLIYRRPAS
ncbi:MAG: lipid-A-disaccharide synthase N-terminal domain-containing protein [bacterium]